MQRRTWVWLAAVALMACRCGPPGPGDYTITNVQENSKPEGYLQGRILDSADGTPVLNATVKTFSEMEVAVPSGEDGLYRLGPLPAGSYTVYVEAVGYLRRTFSAEIAPAPTMFPVGNTVVTKDLDLSRADATIAGIIVTNTGLIAKGAQVYIDLRPSGYDLVASQRTGDDGRFRFEMLPGSALGQQVLVSVAPFDENGDDTPDFAAGARSYTLFPGTTTFNTITLFSLGVQLITSNVSDGELLPNESITLTFNGQLRTNQSTLTLFRNSGPVQVGATVAWEPGNTVVTLTPVGGKLVEGQSYFLTYSVRAVNGAQTTGQLPFVARPATGTPPPGDVNGFRVTLPAGTRYDSALSSTVVSWDLLPTAAGYRIYGKDSAMSSAYLLLSNVSSPAVTTATLGLNLFDSVSGDAFVTPLGHHNTVTLAIVATDRVGNESSFMTAPLIELADNVAPGVSTGTQLTGSANNLNGGAPAMVTFQIVTTELMATDVMPNIVLPNGSTSAIWAWQTTNRGLITITIPAGVDGRGVLTVNGGKDTSDNVQTVAWEGTLL